MRFLDKQTKAILDVFSIDFIEDKKIKIRFYAESGYSDSYTVESLEELNRVLEDYKPTEPYIKDEKVRKVVRAWAECCCIPLVKHYLSDGFSCFICNDEEDNDYCLDFTFRINNLEAEHIYTIEELCGEEEE